MPEINKVAAPIVAVVVVVGVIVLLALGHPVPSELWQAMVLVLGFFFGKTQG